MKLYSDTLIERAEKLGVKDSFLELNDLYERHDKRHVTKTSLSEQLSISRDPRELFGYNVAKTCLSLLCRSKALIESSAVCLENGLLLGSLIIIRSHYETTGNIAFLHNRLLSFYNNTIPFETLNNDLQALALGHSDCELTTQIGCKNVMGQIDAVDCFLKKLYKTAVLDGRWNSDFRLEYDYLSNFTHPNFHGHSFLFMKIDNSEESINYLPTNVIRDKDFPLYCHILNSVVLFLHIFDETMEMVKSNELMPVFHP